MIIHYVRSALRAMYSTRGISVIKIAGLSMGTAVCLVIMTIVMDQRNFDKFHSDLSRIYRVDTRVLRSNGKMDSYATTTYPLSDVLKKNTNSIEQVVRLTTGLSGLTTMQEKKLPVNGFFTDPSFFEVFGFEFLYGTKQQALTQPGSIILSQQTAEKFFGAVNPLGRVLSIEHRGQFVVTGVLKTPPGKTHLLFDVLGSNLALPLLEQEGHINRVTDDWKKIYSVYLYIKVRANTNAGFLENTIQRITDEQYKHVSLNITDKTFQFYLQPLTAIVPGPLLSNNLGKALPLHMIRLFEIFAFIIILSSIFNYSSLSIAQSLKRTREIGIRKVSGASRRQLIGQFLTESILAAIIGLLFSLLLFHFYLVPAFKALNLFQEFDITFKEDFYLLDSCILFGLGIGLLSGFFPALYLSTLPALQTLKGKVSNNLQPKLRSRKVLLIIQFAFALIFTITSINVYRQYKYVISEDYGLNTKDIINIELKGNDYKTMITEVKHIRGVTGVSGISYSMGTGQYNNIAIQLNSAAEKSLVQEYCIDLNYTENLGLVLIAGDNFAFDLSSEKESTILVNEAFIKQFKLGTPEEAVGKMVMMADTMQVRIGGIVKDFHFQSFASPIEPLVLRYHVPDIRILNVRASEKSFGVVIADLEKLWKKADHDHAFTYSFLSDELKYNYKNFRDINKIFQFIALLSVTLACLGLLGLVIFIIRQKLKEISVRKILGATTWQMVFFLFGDFIKLLAIASLIGIPVSILLNTKLLQQYAYRIDPLAGYLLGTFVLAAIVLGVIGARVVRAALINPVKNLRVE